MEEIARTDGVEATTQAKSATSPSLFSENAPSEAELKGEAPTETPNTEEPAALANRSQPLLPGLLGILLGKF